MKWFQYKQNNSGGSFTVDTNVAHNVLIQANSADEADSIAEDVGLYFGGVSSGSDCECCGDRWIPQRTYEWDNSGDDVPSDYGKPLTEDCDQFRIYPYGILNPMKWSELKSLLVIEPS